MAEPRKQSTSVVEIGRSQRGRAKSLNDIISQQTRLLDRLNPEDPRYRRVRDITTRYAENIYNTPESQSDNAAIEAIARSSDSVDEERGRAIGNLNRSIFGRKYPRSVYSRRNNRS